MDGVNFVVVEEDLFRYVRDINQRVIIKDYKGDYNVLYSLNRIAFDNYAEYENADYVSHGSTLTPPDGIFKPIIIASNYEYKDIDFKGVKMMLIYPANEYNYERKTIFTNCKFPELEVIHISSSRSKIDNNVYLEGIDAPLLTKITTFNSSRRLVSITNNCKLPSLVDIDNSIVFIKQDEPIPSLESITTLLKGDPETDMKRLIPNIRNVTVNKPYNFDKLSKYDSGSDASYDNLGTMGINHSHGVLGNGLVTKIKMLKVGNPDGDYTLNIKAPELTELIINNKSLNDDKTIDFGYEFLSNLHNLECLKIKPHDEEEIFKKLPSYILPNLTTLELSHKQYKILLVREASTPNLTELKITGYEGLVKGHRKITNNVKKLSLDWVEINIDSFYFFPKLTELELINIIVRKDKNVVPSSSLKFHPMNNLNKLAVSSSGDLNMFSSSGLIRHIKVGNLFKPEHLYHFDDIEVLKIMRMNPGDLIHERANLLRAIAAMKKLYKLTIPFSVNSLPKNIVEFEMIFLNHDEVEFAKIPKEIIVSNLFKEHMRSLKISSSYNPYPDVLRDRKKDSIIFKREGKYKSARK